MSQMIPLKIADMAVESCNKEIARLLFEKAELQGRVIALEAQLESEKAVIRAHERVDSLIVFNLKTEVERLTFDPLSYLDDQGEWMPRHTHLAAVERLKTEVERLTEIIRRECDGGVDLREEAQRTVEENHKLRAEVERLRKAGDDMSNKLPEIADTHLSDETWLDIQSRWNAAKEGKQS